MWYTRCQPQLQKNLYQMQHRRKFLPNLIFTGRHLVATMLIMSKKPQKADRHKAARKMVAVRRQFHEPAQHVIEREGFTDLTEFVNVAIKEKLERHNAWPWIKRDEK